MKKPSTAKRSSPQTSSLAGAGMPICALTLFLSVAVFAIPVAYGGKAHTPGTTPVETQVEAQEQHNNSMPASAATSLEKNGKAVQQPARLLDSAIEEWPTLDLGLCDGS